MEQKWSKRNSGQQPPSGHFGATSRVVFFDRAIRDSAQADFVLARSSSLVKEFLEDRAHDGIFAVLVAARPDTNRGHVNLQTVRPRKLAFGFVRHVGTP